MCGIAGYLTTLKAKGTQTIARMIGSIVHRGPDDLGYTLLDVNSNTGIDFADPRSYKALGARIQNTDSGDTQTSHNLALGQCRFSIIDISPSGHQPMWSANGRVCAIFNGEIYNYIELKAELTKLKHTFKTSSDTEVLLESYQEWGTGAFEKLNGPFAIVLYDKLNRGLLFARDRIGKSPLYYTVKDGTLYWSSEIKSILSICGVGKFTINPKSVDYFIRYGWRDREGTFWDDIYDFPPASFAWVQTDLSLRIKRYWSLPYERLSAKQIGFNDAIQELRSILINSIKIRTRADVPVAFDLSGGIDSSIIVSMAATQIKKPMTTYTVVFEEKEANEEPYAHAVAEKYMDIIDYKTVRPSKRDFWDAANDFVWLQEEPFHAPNLHTDQEMRRSMRNQGTKVVITGAAGDEVFAGYPGEYIIPYLKYLLCRGDLSSFLTELTSSSEFRTRDLFKFLVLDIVLKQPEFICSLKMFKTERYLINKCYKSQLIKNELLNEDRGFNARMKENMTFRRMNYWLRSGNKATFGIPVETRSPFLDYRIVEFAFKLPPEYLIKNGWHKYILREMAKDILPSEVAWRKRKMGFPFPFKEWLTKSKDIVNKNIIISECPFLVKECINQHYDDLVRVAPVSLWRLVSVALWWRRVIQGEQLIVS
jgi:asparagine synthase (glutamine-hydrolysing)